MKNQFLNLSLIVFVLTTSIVVSIANLPVAAAKCDWHTTTLNISVAEDGIYKETILKETKKGTILKVELTVNTDPNIILTIIKKIPTTGGSGKKIPYYGTVLGFSFKQGDIYFEGWKGKTSAELTDLDDYYAIDRYNICGSGKGSYESNRGLNNAFVKGNIHIDSFWSEEPLRERVELNLQANVNYFAP